MCNQLPSVDTSLLAATLKMGSGACRKVLACGNLTREPINTEALGSIFPSRILVVYEKRDLQIK
jgi:hypothetical protein